MSGFTGTPSEDERLRKRQRVINAYARVFAGDYGKIVLSDLIACFGADRPAFLRCEGGYDPVHAAIRDGQRSVILHIQAVSAQPVVADGDIEGPKTQQAEAAR